MAVFCDTKLDQSKLGQQKSSVMYVCLMQGASFGQVRQTWQTGSACPEQFKVVCLPKHNYKLDNLLTVEPRAVDPHCFDADPEPDPDPGTGDAGEEEGGPGHGSGLQIFDPKRWTDFV